MTIEKDIIIIGSGGHALVLYETLLAQDRNVIGFCTPDNSQSPEYLVGVLRFGDDDAVTHYDPKSVSLVNGVGFLPFSNKRKLIYERFSQIGYCFETVVSESCFVSSSSVLSEGVQVLPNAVVNSGALIGRNTIVNSSAVVEHHTRLGDNCHVAPNATICGHVHTGNNVFFGAGCVILNGINVPDNTVVPAGSIYKGPSDK